MQRRITHGSALLFVAAMSSANAGTPDYIFANGFELTTVFRMTDLDLRDPHVFVALGLLGCNDVTDTVPFDLAPSVNQSIQTNISGDADGNGFLDFSSMLVFRPLRQDGAGARLDTLPGDCLAPSPTAGCAAQVGATPVIRDYATQLAGTCLSPLAGTIRPYSPAIASSDAICFVGNPVDIELPVGAIGVLPLRQAQVAATFVGDPATQLSSGLLRAFLRQADADQILLPPTSPVNPGQPISSLFRGGTGSCSEPAPAQGDRDTLNTESGWWMYFNYTADTVLWTSG